jgi:DNA-directed RNA polymerase subunit RPC12/RpoP
MGKDPSKTKRCPECKRLVDAATMRPLSRSPTGGLRFACPDCFTRVMALRKSVRIANDKLRGG